MRAKLPPILLADPSYYGTLAAVRALGRAGVPVILAGSTRGSSTWSRFVTRRLRAPAIEEPERFVEWLLDFGRVNEGTVLYATSDDVAWLYSAFRVELSRYYRMYQPSLPTLQRLLDKRQLFSLCADVALDAPPTYFPNGDGDEAMFDDAIAAMADGSAGVDYPLLIKPGTQVLLDLHQKGMIVEDGASLPERLHAFGAGNRYHPLVVQRTPEATRPMLQAYYPAGTDSIHSVAGFIDESGTVRALAARKVLQRPRRLGIGLCFEEAPLDQSLVDGVARLARAAGYSGVFEAEFIPADGRQLLIDFNPRFYSQMAFEIDRGLPLPQMAYEAAVGAPVLGGLHGARTPQRPTRAYTHAFIFGLVVAAQGLSGRMSRHEVTSWRAWRRAHRGRLTDAVLDRADPMPLLFEVGWRLRGYLSHPAVSIRSMVLNR